jgi:mannose-6-phosphate isomerase-like protein (cupin superfamily)
MIRSGETLHNPVTLETMTFSRTSRETNGELTSVRITLPPHAPGVFLHRHTTYTELFRVLEGQLSIIAGDPQKPLTLHVGDRQLVPLYALHRFWNATDRPVTFEVEIRPARRFEETIELLFALAGAGRTKPDGSPQHPLDLGIIAQMSESYLPGPPIALQRGVFALLAGIAKLLNYHPLMRLERKRTSKD